MLTVLEARGIVEDCQRSCDSYVKVCSPLQSYTVQEKTVNIKVCELVLLSYSDRHVPGQRSQRQTEESDGS